MIIRTLVSVLWATTNKTVILQAQFSYLPLTPSFISPLMLLSTSAAPMPTFLAISSVSFNISEPTSEPTLLKFCPSSFSVERTSSPVLFSTAETLCPTSTAVWLN